MKKLFIKLVLFIYKKCEKYLLKNNVPIVYSSADYVFDFWGATE